MPNRSNVTPVNIKLTSQFDEKLEEWGIDKDEAKKFGITLVNESKLDFVPHKARGQTLGGVKIQYYNMQGEHLVPAIGAETYHRYRYFFKDTGFTDLEKECKYSQQERSKPVPYFPNVVPWAEVNADIDETIYITEGELKALKASIEHFPTIALGGVDAFRSMYERGLGFLEELEDITWYRRKVYLVYDSDIAMKPDVSRAMNDLAFQLYQRGALCRVVFLPDIIGPSGDAMKCGFDDYLVHHGAEEFEMLLSESIPILDAHELIRMNEKYCYVKTLNTMVNLSTMDQTKVDTAFGNYFANKEFYHGTIEKDVLKMQRVNIGKAWVGWKARNEAYDITYMPGGEMYEDLETKDNSLYSPMYVDTPERRLNCWSGWGVGAKKGDVKPFLKLVNFLLENCSKEEKDWFWKWLAYPIQHPGKKLATCTVIHSTETGTGKTMLGEILGRLYGRNFGVIGQMELQSDFTGWIDSKQLLLGDEISGTGSADARRVADRLKHYITGSVISVNRKNKQPYDIPNCTNFLFTSNHLDAFFIEEKDRRYFIVEAPNKWLGSEFYDEIAAWRDNEDVGIAALMYHLQNLDLGDFHQYSRAPVTDAKKRMHELSETDLGNWVRDLISNEDKIVVSFGVSNPVAVDAELFTTKELINLYDPDGGKRVSERAMGIELRKRGVEKVLNGNQIRTKGGFQVRLWAIRNAKKWVKERKNSVIITHYAKTGLSGAK